MNRYFFLFDGLTKWLEENGYEYNYSFTMSRDNTFDIFKASLFFSIRKNEKSIGALKITNYAGDWVKLFFNSYDTAIRASKNGKLLRDICNCLYEKFKERETSSKTETE